ncbi:MAG: response regulator [Oligoflexales bacterium]
MSKILIVDDHQDTIETIESCIKDNATKIYKANDAKSGWTTFKKVKPDLVITDYGMPEVDGYVLACLIAKESQCPVILVTGYGNIDEKLKSQFVHVFPKPFPIEDFMNTVKDLLKRS